jgi:hypothetical protein
MDAAAAGSMTSPTRRRAPSRRASGWTLALLCVAFAAGPPGSPGAQTNADPGYDAAFVSHSVPAFIELFTPTAVSVTMRNTGTATWLRLDGDVFLSTQRPQDNFYWCIQDNRYGSVSGNRVLLPHDVAPGQEVRFDFVVKPLSCFFAATAPFQFRMLSHLHGTFGELTPNPQVDVGTAAEFVSQQVPATVPGAASINVNLTFKNTTLSIWTPEEGYALGSVGPAGNTTWGTAAVPLPEPVVPGESVRFAFSVVTPAAAGSYNFQWQMKSPAGTAFGRASPATSVEVVAAGPPNYEGLWWATPAGSQAGWGINFAHQGDTIFAAWFTYNSTGRALWLTMTATKTVAGVYTGTLFTSTGPAFDAVPFRPTQVRTVSVGTGTLTFNDPAGTADFAYTVNGVSQTRTLTRQVFGPLPTCTFGLETDLGLAYNYQDLWWAAPAGTEAGWGIFLTHQGDILFATWFTYDRDNAPLWLSATMPRTAAGAYDGVLYRTTGPAFNAVPFDPRNVVATDVGAAGLVFTDGNAGTFTYTVEGVTQSKAVTRQIFQTPGTVCQ